MAHGGLLSLAFDEAIGKLMWLLRAPAVTGKLVTDFIKPVPVGSKLFIKAEIVGQQGRKVYGIAEGRLNGPEGELALKSQAIYIIVPVEHFFNFAPDGFLDSILDKTSMINP